MRSILLMVFLISSLTAAEEIVRFPADAGVIDLTQEPYNAVGDGQTDCSDAIQRALDDYAAKNHILYLPAGTYLVSHQLRWGPSKRLNPDLDEKWAAYNRHRLTILQGERESKTIIKLADNCEGFQNSEWRDKDERPGGSAVIWTGGWPAQRFRNAVRNLTIDTGKGNPGAIGIQFNASNQGTMHRVTVRSGDGQGTIGIDLGFCGDHGPGAGRHLTVEGFDYGVWAATMNSMTLWDLTLRAQRKAGIRILTEELWLSDVVSENTVPALEVGPRWNTFGTVIGGRFDGGGSDQPAIRILGKAGDRHLFCRDLAISGYAKSVEVATDPALEVAEGNLDFWSLHGGSTMFEGDAIRDFGLEVKHAPELPHPKLGKDWANVAAFGAVGAAPGKPSPDWPDDTAGFQAALDSGASTLYIPAGRVWNVGDLTIPASCERIIGCEAYLNGDTWTIAEGARAPLVLERWHPWWNDGRKITLDIRADRTVVVRDLVGMMIHQYGAGDLFVEDVVGQLFLHGSHTKAWCRYLNYEPNREWGIVNEGGKLWIHGAKTEHPGPKVKLTDGSTTEFYGSFWYASHGKRDALGIELVDSQLLMASHRMHSFNKGAWTPFVKATMGGVTKELKDWKIDLLVIGAGNE